MCVCRYIYESYDMELRTDMDFFAIAKSLQNFNTLIILKWLNLVLIGFIASDCHQLIVLILIEVACIIFIQRGGLEGDGYKGKTESGPNKISPHTNLEMFEGITVGRATQVCNECFNPASINTFSKKLFCKCYKYMYRGILLILFSQILEFQRI